MILPESSRLIPSEDLRVVGDGDVFVGGTPTRLLRLTTAGAQVVKRWFEGTPVSHLEAHQNLARRLVDRGLADLECRPATTELRGITVVMPVKDDFEGLVTTLIGLAHPPCDDTNHGACTEADTADTTLPIVVIDDGSSTPIREFALKARIGPNAQLRITVFRLSQSRGPGSARNHGLDAVDTERVVFIDAGVVISRQQIARLMSELDDPGTVAVAPRVVASAPTADGPLGGHKLGLADGHGLSARLIADYETRWSALDLGPRSGLVGPGRQLTYVPSTCLAVDVPASRRAGGFDTDLRYGEDVDFVWRVAEDGWVRYIADAIVSHPPRQTVRQFARQRFQYGTAAGPLAVRHPENLSPVSLTSSSAIVWLGLVAGQPVGIGVAVVAGAVTFRRIGSAIKTALPQSGPRHRLAASLLVEALVGTGLGLATATARTWAPGLLAVGVLSRGRLVGRAIRTLLAIGILRRARPNNAGSAVVDSALGFVDDLAYGAGVWEGARRAKTARPLLARITRTVIAR